MFWCRATRRLKKFPRAGGQPAHAADRMLPVGDRWRPQFSVPERMWQRSRWPALLDSHTRDQPAPLFWTASPRRG
jgi:hypothetical protein